MILNNASKQFSSLFDEGKTDDYQRTALGFAEPAVLLDSKNFDYHNSLPGVMALILADKGDLEASKMGCGNRHLIDGLLCLFRN